MSECKAGPWCLECKKARKISDKHVFDDYKSILNDFTYTLLTPSGYFASGYVCKKAIKKFRKG